MGACGPCCRFRTTPRCSGGAVVPDRPTKLAIAPDPGGAGAAEPQIGSSIKNCIMRPLHRRVRAVAGAVKALVCDVMFYRTSNRAPSV